MPCSFLVVLHVMCVLSFSFGLSICRLIYQSLFAPVFLWFYRSTDLSIHLCTYLFIYLSINLCIYLSIYLSIYLPNDLSTYWSIYLPISLRICILFCSFPFCSVLSYPTLSFSFLLSVLSCPILSILNIFPTYPVCPILCFLYPLFFPIPSILAQSPNPQDGLVADRLVTSGEDTYPTICWDSLERTPWRKGTKKKHRKKKTYTIKKSRGLEDRGV